MKNDMISEKHIPFPLTGYWRIIVRIFATPREFFANFGGDGPGTRQALIFLVSTAIFSSGAAILVHHPPKPLAVFGILFANAVGMCFFAIMVSYIIMIMWLGRKANFRDLFRIFAFASGTTLLLSWIPFSLLFTEIWKWWLIFTGLTMGVGFKKKEAAVVLVLSVFVIVLFFRSLLAVFA